MANAITDTDQLPLPPPPGIEELVDDSLAGLPAPPRVRVRVLTTLLAAISVASMALAWQFRDDVNFAFSRNAAIELGDGRTVDVSQIPANRLVHVRAAPEMAGAVQYTRPLYPGEHTVFPIAGRTGEAMYVQVDGDHVAPGEFTGRLIPFSAAGGRYARVGSFLQHELNAPVHAQTYLIVDGSTPRSLWWAPLLAALLLALAASDAWFLVRLLRPVREEHALRNGTTSH